MLNSTQIQDTLKLYEQISESCYAIQKQITAAEAAYLESLTDVSEEDRETFIVTASQVYYPGSLKEETWDYSTKKRTWSHAIKYEQIRWGQIKSGSYIQDVTYDGDCAYEINEHNISFDYRWHLYECEYARKSNKNHYRS